MKLTVMLMFDFERNLKIDNSSIFKLMNEIENHPKREYELSKLYAQAVKKLEQLTLEFEITQAEIIDDVMRKEKLPPSSRAEVRRSKIQRDNRYKIIRTKIIEATDILNNIQGLYNAWKQRGYSLGALGRIAEKDMNSEVTIYRSKNRSNTSIEKKVKDINKEL